MSALEKPHGSKCPPCTASHKLREVIHRGDKALPLARLVGGRGLSRGLCRSLGMTRRVRLHQGQAGARVVGFLTDLGEGGASAASPEGGAHTPGWPLQLHLHGAPPEAQLLPAGAAA